MAERREWRGGRSAGTGQWLAGLRARLGRGYWERCAYWLLYVVAFGAAVLHWRAGNEALFAACAAAILISIRFIMNAHHRSEQGR
ncbi:MAG: hypothetical protein M0026_06355 [Nocardiopsaceae bacterium]|nr:hypothetical protein [Nocardiopsaceae bacterium]